MQEFIDGATAVAAVLAAIGAWSNARRIDRLTGRVDGLERTVQTVLMILAGRPTSATVGSVPAPVSSFAGGPAGVDAGRRRLTGVRSQIANRNAAAAVSRCPSAPTKRAVIFRCPRRCHSIQSSTNPFTYDVILRRCGMRFRKPSRGAALKASDQVERSRLCSPTESRPTHRLRVGFVARTTFAGGLKWMARSPLREISLRLLTPSVVLVNNGVEKPDLSLDTKATPPSVVHAREPSRILRVDRTEAAVPDGAADLVTDLYRRMPDARITDLLLEVERRHPLHRGLHAPAGPGRPAATASVCSTCCSPRASTSACARSGCLREGARSASSSGFRLPGGRGKRG